MWANFQKKNYSILIDTKFVTSLLLKFSADPKHVSTLPCETKRSHNAIVRRTSQAGRHNHITCFANNKQNGFSKEDKVLNKVLRQKKWIWSEGTVKRVSK